MSVSPSSSLFSSSELELSGAAICLGLLLDDPDDVGDICNSVSPCNGVSLDPDGVGGAR